MGSFDSWDDWDDDWSTTGDSNPTGNTGSTGNAGNGNDPWGGNGGNQPGRNTHVPAARDEWGTRPGPYNGRGMQPQPPMQPQQDPDVLIVRGVTEVPLSQYGILTKLLRGIPITAENQINLALQEAGSLGHGGGAINGVIYGKIESQVITQGMKVKMHGTVKRGQVVIKELYDVDSGGLPININPFWKDPTPKPGQKPGGGSVFAMGAVLLLIALAAIAFFFLKGGVDPSLLQKIKLIAIIVGILVFIKVFRINIFNNSFVQKAILIVALCAIALYVPGGDSVMVLAIIIFGLYMMVKNFMR